MAGLITGIAGLALSAGSTAASFIQAGNQKRKQQDFEADAARALAEARKKLGVNYAEAMSINKEPYNQERLAMLSAGAQIAQAAAESKRGVSAAAGQILASQQVGQTDISNRQGTDMQNVQNAILEEESRLRDINTNLDMQEIAGSQQAASDARLASQIAKQQGIQGIANTVGQGLSMIPLYGGLGGVKGSSAAGELTSSPNAPTAPNAPSMVDASKGGIIPQTNPFAITPSQVGPPNPNDEFSFNSDSNNWERKGYLWNSETNSWEKAFSSMEDAAAKGFMWDATTGKFVKKPQSLFQ